MFAMSGDGKDDVSIPMVFLFSEEAEVLKSAHKQHPDLRVGIYETSIISEVYGRTSTPVSTSTKESENTSKLQSGTGFVESKPNPQSLPKFFGEDEFITAQKRVQLLLSKLHNLQQIKVDLDQLLTLTREFGDESRTSSKDGSNAYQKVTREADFKVAVERLMRKEKILEIDQDVQVLLSRLRQLVQFQPSTSNTKESLSVLELNCKSSTVNPLHSKTAFIHFITDKLGASSNNKKFSAKDCWVETPVGETSVSEHNSFADRTEESFSLPKGDL
ncbi:uncharacterized protein LOC118195670 [Stegodyphus dumicola]|uniref:uncharacterized protein LOC118195670 n=1 Tax=Stegodyphus dumicola TaxID=202533 RepID=UPI0015B19AB3|nr:uncharacterized protein LOC118195670 [Stegodyphus dumicola]